ncbi:alanine:cation symporter family protein, partial [Bacillus haynesii]
NEKYAIVYRVIFVIAVFFGAVFKNDFVWALADMLNGLMAIPNLIGLLGLTGIVIYESKQILAKIKAEKEEKQNSVSV